MRVANLTEYSSCMRGIHCMKDLMDSLVEHFCSGTIMLTRGQVDRICEIEKGYLDPDFIAGRSLHQE